MASKRDVRPRFSSTGSGLRESLGPPMRVEGATTAGRAQGVPGPAKRRSRVPVMSGGTQGGFSSSVSTGKRPPTASQQQRRQTQVIGRSRTSSTGRSELPLMQNAQVCEGNSRFPCRSSIYGQSTGQVKKDPRPLSDKGNSGTLYTNTQ